MVGDILQYERDTYEEGEIIFDLINKYFWNDTTHNYDCPEGFLKEVNNNYGDK